MRVQDIDLSKESIQVQEFADATKNILNNGGIEIDTYPGAISGATYPAPRETKLVLQLFGTQYRLYISYGGNWYYTTLTKV